MPIQSSFVRRSARILLGLTVLIGSMAAANAGQTRIKFNLDPGATSGAISIPARNVPVSLTGVTLTYDVRGVGQATLLAVKPALFIQWVGFDYADGGTPSTGWTAVAGTHIIWLDYAKQVDVQVRDATHIQIKNSSVSKRKGVITMTWVDEPL